MQSLLRRTTAFLTPNSSSNDLSKSTQQYIFPRVSPSIDGPDCLEDCSTCTIHYPSKFSIDESHQLYGQIKGWSTHLLIASGKSDWVRDIADEKGSLMEAVARYGMQLKNGRVMVSACNMPVPEYECQDRGKDEEKGCTEVLVLPSWEIVERVPPSKAADFMGGYVARASTTRSPIMSTPSSASLSTAEAGATPHPPSQHQQPDSITTEPNQPSPSQPSLPFPTRPCPHKYLILLCSQATRDIRCGQSAPLLRREFERHLRPLGLYRDMHDHRPGGVGIYFISHVGGHKYSANVLVYRREVSVEGDGEGMSTRDGIGKEAAQCIWLARVRPEDCEGIVKYTILQGKVVKPDSQLRGGFDRGRGVTSW